LLKPIEKNPQIIQQPRVEEQILNVLTFFETVFRTDVTIKILKVLSNREGVCLREIARKSDTTPKNLVKYMETLTKEGVITIYSDGKKANVYTISTKYSFLRDFL